jgi:hypothetical protein
VIEGLPAEGWAVMVESGATAPEFGSWAHAPAVTGAGSGGFVAGFGRTGDA